LKGHTFPETVTENKKIKTSFSTSWYFKKLSDGTLQRRPWLSYSEKTDSVYCLDCILFGSKSSKSRHPQFSKVGFRNWRRGNAAFIEHETSESHVMASITSELRKVCLPLNPSMKEAQLRGREQNREIVRQLIDVTLYLAQHSMALRGHREGKAEKFRGNFLDLVTLLAKYSPALNTYLSKISGAKKKVWNFMSHNRQNQLIQAVSEFIRKEVVKEINAAHFFSVSFDESVDSSRKEQCTCIIRYVRSDTGTVAERLVAVKECAVTSGEKLFEVLTSIFEELQLDWTSCLVGQAYDGASNMRGAYHGLQALVREKAESAIYVWCWAHRLSLAVKEAAGCCLDAVDLFANLKKVYNVINGSKNNVETYEKIFKDTYPGKQILRLKRVDTTRWMSHSFALTTVLRAFEAIVETLDHISKNGVGEPRVAANGLLSYFMSEKFVLTAFTFESIYREVEPLSTSLQGVDVDLMAAVNHVEVVLKALRSLRSEESFADLLKRKEDFITDSAFTREAFKVLPAPAISQRTRKRRVQDGERAADEPIIDPLMKFRVETFFASVDNIISLISERFNDRAQSLYKDLALLTKKRIAEVESDHTSLPEDAFLAFSTLYSKFVNPEDLRNEYKLFSKTFPAYEKVFNKLPKDLHSASSWMHHDDHEHSQDQDAQQRCDDGDEWFGFDEEIELEAAASALDSPPQLKPENMVHSGSLAHTLYVVHNTGLKTIFPSLYIALKIAVTLPVTSASTERSFSKLKLIKNRLRSTMGQDRLEDLMIIACERDINIDIEAVVSIFSSYSKYLSDNL